MVSKLRTRRTIKNQWKIILGELIYFMISARFERIGNDTVMTSDNRY